MIHPVRTLVVLVLAAGLLTAMSCEPAGRKRATGQQTFASPQVDPIALSEDGLYLFVANTAAGTVDVVSTGQRSIVRRFDVGLDPVSVAVRPGGGELWVANHVSDSISVIDTSDASVPLWGLVDTIQDVDPVSLVTNFDEPVDIAFANADKAYVTLSSRDQVAVIDANTRQVTGHIDVASQEPRAMRVRGGRLYVASLESGNQTELSSCPTQVFAIDGDQCTFDQGALNFATNPNLVGGEVDIVRDPRQPDRDLYVYDTADETLLDAVESVGTLLYGLAVDSQGRAFISLTEARNDVNGRAGTQGQGLPDLDNRMFLNQVARVDCAGTPCAAPLLHDLEPLPPAQPSEGTQLATPYGIALSADDQTVVVTAAASHRVFTLDAASGQVLGIASVGAVPRGVAVASAADGSAETAWVLNTVDASVSVVDVSDPANPSEVDVIALQDPTPPSIKAGRIAFNDANASSTGTFSCASCHPDSHTDQLLWVIGGECTFAGCDQEEPRSTMPIRGLRDTLPLHWDGLLGDPIGGTNGEILSNPLGLAGGTVPVGIEVAAPNCTDEHSCFRQLVDSALSGVMCNTVGCTTNEAGRAGRLTEAERDAMAEFLRNVPYPPARKRRPDDTLTTAALGGFEDFFLNKGGVNGPGPGGAGPETCADAAGGCHALPFGAGTNSLFVGGFDAPTMRGINDRFLLFSAGVTNIFENLILSSFISDAPWTPADGPDEFANWALAFGSANAPGAFRDVYNTGPFDIFEMVEEGSTGYSGALGRQVTLNARTTASELPAANATLDILERAADDGIIALQAVSAGPGAARAEYVFDAGKYRGTRDQTRSELIALAQGGGTAVTVTARLPRNATPEHPQPAIWVDSVGAFLFDGRLDLPQLPAANPMLVSGRHIVSGAQLFIDGQRVDGSIRCVGGRFSPTCDSEQIEITLDAIPASGTRLLQVATPHGLLSNEMPILVQ